MENDEEAGKSQRHTEHGEAQKQRLVDAAYSIIAERGFEGLRTRDVAARTGLNISTLHYYFPSKQDLVRAVAQRFLLKFQNHSEAKNNTTSALEKLHKAFENQGKLIEANPSNFVVMLEIFTRSLRDPSIRGIIREVMDSWEHYLLFLISQGMGKFQLAEGSDPVITAKVMQSLLLGMTMNKLLDTKTYPVEPLFQQVARWLEP
jgi:AcrR family transcriptional regulator